MFRVICRPILLLRTDLHGLAGYREAPEDMIQHERPLEGCILLNKDALSPLSLNFACKVGPRAFVEPLRYSFDL